MQMRVIYGHKKSSDSKLEVQDNEDSVQVVWVSACGKNPVHLAAQIKCNTQLFFAQAKSHLNEHINIQRLNSKGKFMWCIVIRSIDDLQHKTIRPHL